MPGSLHASLASLPLCTISELSVHAPTGSIPLDHLRQTLQLKRVFGCDFLSCILLSCKQCIAHCRENPYHFKALYRRAMTHAELHNYEAAAKDLQTAKEADPSSVADIDRELVRLKAREAAANSRQRKQFGNFFAHK